MRKDFLILILSVAVLLANCVFAAAERPAKRKVGAGTGVVDPFRASVLPVLKSYCFDCHGDGAKKGDFSLDGFSDTASVHQDRKSWENVLQNLRSGAMPPVKRKSQPTQSERERVVKWIEDELFPVDCNNPDPGRVTVRRLNRTEYNNTIRDLMGIDFRPAEDFPQDDVGYGFDNIGDVLSMPPLLLEKYVTASEQVLDEAIVTEDLTRVRTRRFQFEDLTATAPVEERSNGWFALVREGDVHLNFKVRASGDYVVRVRAAGEQAGPEPVKMAIEVEGQAAFMVVVPETRKEARVHEVRFHSDRGSVKIAVRYLNNYFNAKEPDPKNRDRNLLLEWIETEGPFNPGPQTLPESHRRIFVREAGSGNAKAAAREILQKFARRAWRRPVETQELKRLVALYELARGQGDSFEKSVKLALQAVLVSPSFLFRGEIQPEPDNPQRVHPVSEIALASRLSYFLWSSMPDEELLQLAEAGKLRRNLEVQLRRLLLDPRSKALVDNFGAQWLQTRNLEIVNPDRTLFPAFSEELRRDLGRETALFLDFIIKEDRSVLELLDADYSFLNERLAKLYGVTGVAGEELRRVVFQDRRRGGLLTQGSILTITSNPTRTSPVKRGKWVMENILGTPPPPNVPELKVDKDHPLVGTLRQKMEQHRENPLCASCHDRMDAIGFGFENYDAIGAWRGQEGGADIDPAGKLGTGESFQGPADLKRVLMEKRRQDFMRCLTEKLLTYALGRGIEYYDRCAIDRILVSVQQGGFRFSSLVREIAQSAPFQKRRGEGSRGSEE